MALKQSLCAIVPQRVGRGLTLSSGPRGFPIRAGWKSAAEASVQASDKARSLPMLAVPGCLEKDRLPNAVAVMRALKRHARVRGDCKKSACPDRQAIT